MRHRLWTIPGLCLLLAGLRAQASVVWSEIHYHPVEEPSFNPDGSPILDLGEDVHEFVEVQNTGGAPVDLGGWTLSGGIDFTFPPGTTLASGGFQVVARNPSRLASVYGLSPSTVLGPYTGTLSNQGESLRLRDAAGALIEQIAYSSSFPWAMSANALGAQDRFTGLSSLGSQYKGRSLQRVSTEWGGNDPANWLASPLIPGPTPGAAQAITRAAPKPVVLGLSHSQTSNGDPVVQANQEATVRAAFSSSRGIDTPRLEYFVDNVNATGEARISVPMTLSANGVFLATIPGQTSRAIVRYRIKADRGDGEEVVSPRADDPQIVPVGTGGAREAWHGYFVTPSRTSTRPAYDLLIATTKLATLSANIGQTPSRVTSATAQGVPREVPYVPTGSPEWNGTVPAVFAFNGELFDVHIRYHGSRYHRSTSNLSFKLHFPENHPHQNQTSWFVTGHGASFAEMQGLNRLLGLPSSAMQAVDWYFNSNSLLVRYEQGEYAGEMLDAYHELRQRLNPGSIRERNGELYKVIGNLDASQNNLEGPYTKGDQAPMLANQRWTQLQRYEWNYTLQNNAWKGHLPIRNLMESLWPARGDSPAAPDLDVPGTRAWFAANFDLESTLNSLALLEWCGIWDDSGHNQFFWRKADGRWVRLGWDYDDVLNTQFANQPIYGNEAEVDIFHGPNWWKDSFFKAYRAEFNQRLWELNNSVLDQTNLGALGFPKAAAYAAFRQASVNNQLGFGSFTKPNRPVNQAPSADAVVLGPTALVSSPYVHPTGSAHQATQWEICPVLGTFEDPVLRITSTNDLLRLEIPVDALVYGQTYRWRVTHIDAAGHTSFVSAETRFSWGLANPAAGTITLNEILADNRKSAENQGSFPDYVELKNNSAVPVTLGGYGLTDDPADPEKYLFPSGTSLAANARLLVWCDSETTAPGLHSGFKLSADGQTVLLTQGSTVMDSVTFGPQAPDLAIGRVADGTGGWQACLPTPGEGNTAAILGTSTGIRFNEWMAAPASGSDWFELYNPGPLPVCLGSHYLSDSPASPRLTRLPTLTYLAAGDIHLFLADDSSVGANHVAFKLAAGGDDLVFTAPDGLTTLDTVTFATQQAGLSQGRLPDGAESVVSFPQSASPGKSNSLPAPVVIHEALAHSAAPEEDYVELYNPTGNAIDISNWWLSDDASNPKKFALPSGSVLPGDGFLVLTEAQFNLGPQAFSLSSLGDEILLSAVDAGGALTGSRSRVGFGASAGSVSWGRVEVTGGSEFWPQTQRTPGGTNAAPVTTPVLINEIHFHPPDGPSGQDNLLDEFIELHNPTDGEVSLSDWRLRGDSDYAFPSGTSIPARGFLVITHIDSIDPVEEASFRSRHPTAAGAVLLGPYSSKLANDTHGLELSRPGSPIGLIVPQLLVDKVEYLDRAPWPAGGDGDGLSLQRIHRGIIGNDPSNWAAAPPTPGAINDAVTEKRITTAPQLPGALLDTAYTGVLQAAGGSAPYAWSVFAGELPPGLLLSQDGGLSGIPSAAGAFFFTVRVTDALGASLEQACHLNVATQALILTTAPTLEAGQAGVAYSTTLSANGGTPSYSWSKISGVLPAGLSLGQDGTLAGMPSSYGSFAFTARLADSGGLVSQSALTLVIAPPALQIDTETLPDAFMDTPYFTALRAIGGTGGYVWAIDAGLLPTGIALSASGSFSGTPSVLESPSFTVRVTDNSGSAITRSFVLAVQPRPLSITTSALPAGVINGAYATTFTATGGSGDNTWQLTAGTLPDGLSLSPSGVLSGSPEESGVFHLTLRVTDRLAVTAERSFSLTVASSGPLDHFTWDYHPAVAYAGRSFAAQLSARDAENRLVVSYSGPATLSASVTDGTAQPVVITEVTDEAENQFEIQNVGSSAVDTTGWYVRVGDRTSLVNVANTTTYFLPSILAAGQILRVSEQNIAGRSYFGAPISWISSNSRGWVMLLDNTHTLRDFFAFGWTSAQLANLTLTLSGRVVNPLASGHWAGNGAVAGTRGNANSTSDSWSRTGSSENQTSADWSWSRNAQTLGAANPALALPWLATSRVIVSPNELQLEGGVFAGLVQPGQIALRVTLTAREENGPSGSSGKLDFLATPADTDADGMDDAWESAHGLQVGAVDAEADEDEDGLTNIEEFMAGTLPDNPASRLFVLDATRAPGGGFTLAWPAEAGVFYEVETSPDLLTWTTAVARSLSLVTGPRLEVIPSHSQPVRYARVRVVP